MSYWQDLLLRTTKPEDLNQVGLLKAVGPEVQRQGDYGSGRRYRFGPQKGHPFLQVWPETQKELYRHSLTRIVESIEMHRNAVESRK